MASDSEGGADDFGNKMSFNFGSTTLCIDLWLDLLTNEYGYATELWLVNDATWEWLWYNWGFGNNE